MLLAVDVGNTQTHFGTFRGVELIEHWRFQTRSGATGDELGERIAGFFNLSEMNFGDIDAVVVSSVVPPLGSQFERMTERYLEAECLTIGPGVKSGMPIRIDNPLEVGADRLAGDVLAEPDRQRRPASGRVLEDVAELHDPPARVGHLDADRGLAGDRREDADVGRGQRVGEVVLELGDLAHLHAGREPQLGPLDQQEVLDS